jgi:hypothetical protein
MRKTEYKVRFYMDNSYEVLEVVTIYDEEDNSYASSNNRIKECSVFHGSLSDCEAYIRLKESNYMY